MLIVEVLQHEKLNKKANKTKQKSQTHENQGLQNQTTQERTKTKGQRVGARSQTTPTNMPNLQLNNKPKFSPHNPTRNKTHKVHSSQWGDPLRKMSQVGNILGA